MPNRFSLKNMRMIFPEYLFSSRRASGEEKIPVNALSMRTQQEKALIDKNSIHYLSRPCLSCRIDS
jgi:hypothetical protein